LLQLQSVISESIFRVKGFLNIFKEKCLCGGIVNILANKRVCVLDWRFSAKKSDPQEKDSQEMGLVLH